MRRILTIFLILTLAFSCNTGAIYFFEPEAIERETGVGEIGLPDTEDVMMPSSSGKTFKETVLEGWASFSEEIDVSEFDICGESMEELKINLAKVYNDVFFNNPLYYYIDRHYMFRYDYKDDDVTMYITSICPTYTTTDRDEIAAMHKAIDEETDNILLYIENDMTDFEKVMTVHDYMVIHYDYDYSYENHSISIMATKTGVCESYTFAFMHIMDILGIESRYVSSDAMNHAWNLVKIDGNWYHVDLTWDDSGRADQTGHQFELLSDKKIQELEDPHYGYDTGGLVADSDIYDEAEWHNNHSQVVSLKGTVYWVKDNALVSDKGDIVNSALDGGDSRWSIGGGYSFNNSDYTSNYTGLAVFNGKLYYNTDKAVFAYNPKTKQSVKVKDIDGVCGIHIDGNILKHGMYDREKVVIINGKEHVGDFYEADDTIKLAGARITVPYIKNGKAVAKIYTDGTEHVNIMSFGKNGAGTATAKEGVTSVEIDTGAFDYIYFFDDNLNPLHDKVKITD